MLLIDPILNLINTRFSFIVMNSRFDTQCYDWFISEYYKYSSTTNRYIFLHGKRNSYSHLNSSIQNRTACKRRSRGDTIFATLTFSDRASEGMASLQLSMPYEENQLQPAISATPAQGREMNTSKVSHKLLLAQVQETRTSFQLTQSSNRT